MKLSPTLRSFLLEHSCKDDLLILSPRLIKSYKTPISLLFTKTENLDLDKKIEGLACILAKMETTAYSNIDKDLSLLLSNYKILKEAKKLYLLEKCLQVTSSLIESTPVQIRG